MTAAIRRVLGGFQKAGTSTGRRSPGFWVLNETAWRRAPSELQAGLGWGPTRRPARLRPLWLKAKSSNRQSFYGFG